MTRLHPTRSGVENMPMENRHDPAGLASDAVREVHWTVKSERHNWSIQQRKQPAVAAARLSAGLTQSVQPWTSVNDCTALLSSPGQRPAAEMHGPAISGRSACQPEHQGACWRANHLSAQEQYSSR